MADSIKPLIIRIEGPLSPDSNAHDLIFEYICDFKLDSDYKRLNKTDGEIPPDSGAGLYMFTLSTEMKENILYIGRVCYKGLLNRVRGYLNPGATPSTNLKNYEEFKKVLLAQEESKRNLETQLYTEDLDENALRSEVTLDVSGSSTIRLWFFPYPDLEHAAIHAAYKLEPKIENRTLRTLKGREINAVISDPRISFR
jgi:hypothetical protein